MIVFHRTSSRLRSSALCITYKDRTKPIQDYYWLEQFPSQINQGRHDIYLMRDHDVGTSVTRTPVNQGCASRLLAAGIQEKTTVANLMAEFSWRASQLARSVKKQKQGPVIDVQAETGAHIKALLHWGRLGKRPSKEVDPNFPFELDVTEEGLLQITFNAFKGEQHVLYPNPSDDEHLVASITGSRWISGSNKRPPPRID